MDPMGYTVYCFSFHSSESLCSVPHLAFHCSQTSAPVGTTSFSASISTSLNAMPPAYHPHSTIPGIDGCLQLRAASFKMHMQTATKSCLEFVSCICPLVFFSSQITRLHGCFGCFHPLVQGKTWTKKTTCSPSSASNTREGGPTCSFCSLCFWGYQATTLR